MKRLICLFLAFLMIFSLAACGAQKPAGGDDEEPGRSSRRVRHDAQSEENTSPETTAAPDETAAPEASPAPTPVMPAFPETPASAGPRSELDPASVPEDLLLFLARFAWYGRGDGDFRGQDPNAVDLMRRGFELIVDFDAYPGPAAGHLSGPDPRGRWTDCEVYLAEKLDWILKNVYGLSDSAIDAMRLAGEESYARFYYQDGYYYLEPLGVGGGFVCMPCYAESDGVSIYLCYAAYSGDVVFYPAGIQYAVVSPVEIDGARCWTLSRWSREPDIFPDGADVSDYAFALGDWVLAEDGLSSLRLELSEDQTLSFFAGFYRLIGFTAESQPLNGSGDFAFAASDGSEYMGRMTVTRDAVSLRLFTAPDEYGHPGFDGYFDGKSFVFVRPEPELIPEDDFSITPDELAQEIERIREYYYSPGAADRKLVLQNGTDGWNYSREYYYHDGKLVFAFIYDGTEEHRLYFKDGHMIRYIDENKTVYDYGSLEPYAAWAERALEEAARLFEEAPDADPSRWLGTWYAENGEWIAVTAASRDGLSFTYHHYLELGTIDARYELPFLDEACTFVAEEGYDDPEAGWRYSFRLEGDHIVVYSRYPDNYFYK